MSRGFNIEYLRAPELTRGAGVGAGIAAIGDSFMKLGQIGLNRQKIDDEKQRYIDEKSFSRAKFDWEVQKAKDDAAARKREFDTEILLKNKELELRQDHNRALAGYYASFVKDGEYKRKRQEAEDNAKISLFEKMDPELASKLTREEKLLYGNRMQNMKDGGVDMYKKSIPVDRAFAEKYFDSGHVKVDDKSGEYYATPFIVERDKEFRRVEDERLRSEAAEASKKKDGLKTPSKGEDKRFVERKPQIDVDRFFDEYVIKKPQKIDLNRLDKKFWKNEDGAM